MGNFLSVPVLALAAILQATFVPQIRILGGAPDLVFLLVLAWAVNSPLEMGVTWAFVGGIIQDMLSAAPTGASVVGMVVAVFLVHIVAGQIYRISFTVLVLLVVGGSLIKQVLFIVVLALTGFQVRLVEQFIYIVAPTVVYNLVVFWPVYLIVRRLQRRLVDPRIAA